MGIIYSDLKYIYSCILYKKTKYGSIRRRKIKDFSPRNILNCIKNSFIEIYYEIKNINIHRSIIYIIWS